MTGSARKGRAERGGTWRVMKLRDWLTLAAIVGGLVLMFMITRYSQPERVKPGSPEYVEYIDHYIAECLRNPQSFDRSHSELPSEAEREAACRNSVQQADPLKPTNRQVTHPTTQCT